MDFKIGQKVSYPNHGVCAVESVESKSVSGNSVDFYTLRLLAFNSVIFVPTDNAESVGLRPLISQGQCQEVLTFLAQDFEEIESDWKIRIRDFLAKVQTGDIILVAEVLKKLTFLIRGKQLSFREQRLLEKTKYLIVSEVATACSKEEADVETKVDKLLAKACERHLLGQIPIVSYATH